MVYPTAARGKRASAEGVLERIGADDHEANAAAREHAKAHPAASDFGQKYQIKATGAVIR
jgi:hypothetical protein